ncbi:MOSC domain-containing protein [Streptomyces sp. LP05-1]|uniref:MOSC domain-containing protein n=1 Tax=Streptomyces pyxinae TaxID=2970734 RepID=A0ABT2CI83_9ACTN|nr:MOSC domain-containing protein [Streptomyces sp. LP05-1]MCS0637124.1 MOSC domain-containing protein [Streptomyces sp. LP05-1]
MKLLTVNVGRPRSAGYTDAPSGTTGIDKRPADGPVRVTDPGAPGAGGSGVAGDTVSDLRFHGGTHQAVYAFAREELDHWEAELGRPLANGSFGENLTTSGADLDAALIGERWRVGTALLEVASVRLPCRTFAGWLDERGWVKRFTRRASPGAYFRVLEPGEVRAGEPIRVVHRPAHQVTTRLVFRAVTLERPLLPEILAAGEALHPDFRETAHTYLRTRTASATI